jgi:hypothetical protein
MFNEVHKTCESCGRYMTIQISQIVLGFGEFYLDNPGEITDKLDLYQRGKFAEMVNEEEFHCECGWDFKPDIRVRQPEETGIIFI